MPADGLNRREAAAAGFATAAVLAYAGLRVASWAAGEPDPREVVASESVGYYVRVGLATWLGALGAATGWWWPRAGDRAAAALPWVVAGAVAVAFLLP